MKTNHVVNVREKIGLWAHEGKRLLNSSHEYIIVRQSPQKRVEYLSKGKKEKLPCWASSCVILADAPTQFEWSRLVPGIDGMTAPNTNIRSRRRCWWGRDQSLSNGD